MVIEEFLKHHLKNLGLQQSGKRKLLRAQRKLLRQKARAPALTIQWACDSDHQGVHIFKS